MYNIDDIKKFMIQSSKDFCCPITGEILDYRKSVIIRSIKYGNDSIVSVKGFDALILKKPETAKHFKIISDIGEY